MKRLVLFTVMTAIVIISGCDSSSTSTTTAGSGGTESGTYVADDVNSNGRALTLPEGVSVSDLDGDNTAVMAEMDHAALITYSTCITGCTTTHADNQELLLECMMECLDDSGFSTQAGAFSVAITLTNSGSTTETVTLYAGTVLSPASSDYQPMMLIQDIDLTIPPGSDTFMLPAFCLAPDKDAPDAGNSYTISGLTSNSCLQTILTILATKDIDNFTYAHISTVQDSVWHCVEDNYTAADTTALNGLP